MRGVLSAGGLFYHLRALHAARGPWRPFRAALGGWLAEWKAAPVLFLVGPSAGYCIDDVFFARFEEIVAFEPDGLARLLLGRRLRHLGVREVAFVADDRLIAPLLRGEPAIDDLLRARPGASVLFSNLMGQLPFLVAEARQAAWRDAWKARVLPALATRAWASFHDRCSTSEAPRASGRHDAPSRLPDASLATRFFPAARGELVLHDHETQDLFPAALPHSYFHWEIERGAHHLIEAVRMP